MDPPQPAKVASVQLQNIMPRIDSGAALHVAVGGKQPEQGFHQRCFTAPGLPDQTEDVPSLKDQIHSAYGLNGAPGNMVADR